MLVRFPVCGIYLKIDLFLLEIAAVLVFYVHRFFLVLELVGGILVYAVQLIGYFPTRLRRYGRVLYLVSCSLLFYRDGIVCRLRIFHYGNINRCIL